ncbi:MAG TPA: hypothetical protein VLA76_03055 [Candidatus Angelobacter sp.]|nr:hypothetical protein [Candidatus Angelobacter sp.]
MFARDDVHRGRRVPLAWVFGPLVLGALLVTAVGIGIRATQGFPDIELAERLEQVARGGDPLLAEVTDFEWDRVCVFPSRLPSETVDETLGIDWGVVGGDRIDNRWLLVFVHDNEVVKHFYLQRGLVDRPAEDGDCRAPDEESTRL